MNRDAQFPSLQGKTALVTGSTDGVGRLVATELGRLGAHVIVQGRSRARGDDVVRDIRARGGNAVFEAADLASLAEVRRLAEAVHRHTDRLDVLVNNAGIGTGRPGDARATSADGFELRFAVNYLAGFLLTHLLLPMVRASAPARIVFVASLGQMPLDFDDLMLQRDFSGMRAYCQSKLAQIMETIELARELDGTGVTVNSIHPATYMATTMVREAGVKPTSTVEEGAAAVLRLAAAPEIEGVTGEFFDGVGRGRANAQAYRSEDRRRLREVSLRLTGLAKARSS